MNDRITRPKTTSSGMTRASKLSYSLNPLQPELWQRSDGSGKASVWVEAKTASEGILGITGSRFSSPPRWSFDIGPQCGGFLPVLKVSSPTSSRAADLISSAKSSSPRHRNGDKSKKISTLGRNGKIHVADNQISDCSEGSASKKLLTESSLFDLSSLIPPLMHNRVGEARLSSPAKDQELSVLHRLRSPVQKCVYSAQSESPTQVSKRSDESAYISLNEELARLLEPRSPVRAEARREGGNSPSAGTRDSEIIIGESAKAYSTFGDSPDHLASRLKLNVTVPTSKSTDDENNNISEAIEHVMEVNQPKSILRFQLENKLDGLAVNENVSSVKRTIDISTCIIPGPPLIPTNSLNGPRKVVRRNLRKMSSREAKGKRDGGAFTEVSSDSSSSLDVLETGSDSTHKSDVSDTSKSDSTGRSVHFSTEPVVVKEYYPWEAPNQSLQAEPPKYV